MRESVPRIPIAKRGARGRDRQRKPTSGASTECGLTSRRALFRGAVGSTGGKWHIAPFSNGRAQGRRAGSGRPLGCARRGVGGHEWHEHGHTPCRRGRCSWTEKLRNEGLLYVPESVRSAIKSHAVRQPLNTTDINAIGAGLVQCLRVKNNTVRQVITTD